MNKKEMLLKLERQLEIVTKRKRNLEARMVEIDERPNNLITKDTYKEWHEVYCKVSYLNLRIETIKSKMQMLSDKDIVRDVISSSKGLFNYLRRAN
jgi:chaperonin cofactor prefoldin